MSNTPEDINAKIKAFILEEFLPGESEEALTDSTELVTHGVLDSLSTLQLATFIEQEYPVKLQAHEVNIDYLNTLTDITNLIVSKLKT
jgi:acyl carrier protein